MLQKYGEQMVTFHKHASCAPAVPTALPDFRTNIGIHNGL